MPRTQFTNENYHSGNELYQGFILADFPPFSCAVPKGKFLKIQASVQVWLYYFIADVVLSNFF